MRDPSGDVRRHRGLVFSWRSVLIALLILFVGESALIARENEGPQSANPLRRTLMALGLPLLRAVSPYALERSPPPSKRRSVLPLSRFEVS